MTRPWRKPSSRAPPTPVRACLSPWIALPFCLFALLFLIHLHLSPLPSFLLLLPPLSSTKPPGDPKQPAHPNRIRPPASCDFSRGRWARGHRPLHYNASCPFHRNAWNCLRNGREDMDSINSWVWVPDDCGRRRNDGIDPASFLETMRGRRIGLVGDSLNENFLVAFLCILRSADGGARKWKRKGAWKGGYFPKYDVIVAYHRAVLLARYEWQPRRHLNLPDKGLKGAYKVDVDVPANDWINVTTFYDVLVFNTGHWWGHDKFPKDTPLVFYRQGKPIDPPLDILDGLQVVLTSMVHYIEEKVPKKTLRFWRMQSPRHFYGGDWNQNGSCLFKEPLEENQLDAWFNPINGGVNREVREVNHLIRQALMGTDIQLLNLTYLSEFRADAHPAVWLGKKDAVAIWGQDCMHWCLPGVPDTWVDILAEQILDYFRIR